MGVLTLEGIKTHRMSKNMTQQQLADCLGVSRTTVTMWELGENAPSAEMLGRIADTFDCSIDALMGRALTDRR